MFKTLELPGGFAPLAPYQGFDLDLLGALSGPQTPRPVILHPPFLIPGYGPVNVLGENADELPDRLHSRLDLSPRKWKVGCLNSSRDRPKS